jgi:hypothetical protein
MAKGKPQARHASDEDSDGVVARAERPVPEFEILDDQMAAIWRQKTGAERIQIASDLFAFARKLTLSSVRSMHPDWSEEQIWRETARRLSHGAV